MKTEGNREKSRRKTKQEEGRCSRIVCICSGVVVVTVCGVFFSLYFTAYVVPLKLYPFFFFFF